MEVMVGGYQNLTKDEINNKFVTACYDGDLDRIKYLFSLSEFKYGDIYREGFRFACVNGHLEIVKLLSDELVRNGDVFKDGEYGLKRACYSGYIEVVRYLLASSELKKHINIHVDSDYCFKYACGNGRLEIIKYLLASPEIDEHADIHVCNDIGFRWACLNGQVDVVKYLASSSELVECANIHACNDEGFVWACENNYYEIINFLIFKVAIEKTDAIKKFLKDDEYLEVENMFKIRDLNKQLENELDSACNKNKNKNKI